VATIYWRGECAYLNWRENGRQVRLSLGAIDAREAEKVRSAKEAELTHGVRILARLPTVRAYLEWYLDWYEAEHPTTGAKARSEVKRFMARFGHRPIDTIKPTEIEGFKADRLRLDKAAPETVGKELRRLKAAFNRGVEWKELDVNPLEAVKAPRGVRSVAVRFYSSADMKKLYEANPRRAKLWAFMAHTGIRRGEMCKFKLADVVNGAVRIESEPDESGMGRTKSGIWREVPLNRQAKAAFATFADPVIAVHPDTLSDWFTADSRAAKIGGSLHRLRHTFCAHLVSAGVPLRRVQMLAGHADYKVTERYAHLAPGGNAGAVSKLRF
jgi:integrase